MLNENGVVTPWRLDFWVLPGLAMNFPVHEYIYIIYMRASRMDWVAAIDIAIPPLPAAVGRAAASMRTESPSWSSLRHDGALPLAGQQTSRASGPATHARDEHACCGSIPRFSVRAQEAGPRHSAVKFQCGLQPDFPGLSISHVMASCMQRAVCCCAEHQT